MFLKRESIYKPDSTKTAPKQVLKLFGYKDWRESRTTWLQRTIAYPEIREQRPATDPEAMFTKRIGIPKPIVSKSRKTPATCQSRRLLAL